MTGHPVLVTGRWHPLQVSLVTVSRQVGHRGALTYASNSALLGRCWIVEVIGETEDVVGDTEEEVKRGEETKGGRATLCTLATTRLGERGGN